MSNQITCYLIRHGKTPGNLEKRYIGAKTDESLSAKGIDELVKLRIAYSEILKSKNNIRFYSGPMKRCIETLEILFPDTKYEVIDNLTEIDFGDFEGHNYSELSDNPDYQRWIDSNGTMTFPNGEPRADFIKRSIESINNCKNIFSCKNDSSNPNNTEIETIVIICHGGNIMAYLSSMTGKDYFDFQCEPGMGYKVEISEGVSNVITSYHRISDWLRA
ncbi:MAG: histidine phosphatase family protein [Eubacterium sp.]|nr:histidine phosphatase family protein [Eubacterium sp.]